MSTILSFLSKVFDRKLQKYREVYIQNVNNIIPTGATRQEIVQYHSELVTRYYKHKDDRRYVFYTYLVLIPPMFVGIFYLKKEGINLYYLLDIMTMLFTVVTMFMFSLYRRKIMKKAIQIIAFQKKFKFLPKDFVLSSELSYSKENKLLNEKISTTTLYRIVTLTVLLALLVLLFV